jgi:hypothetical protein
MPPTSEVRAYVISKRTLPLREVAFDAVEFVSLALPPDKFFISNFAS